MTKPTPADVAGEYWIGQRGMAVRITRELQRAFDDTPELLDEFASLALKKHEKAWNPHTRSIV